MSSCLCLSISFISCLSSDFFFLFTNLFFSYLSWYCFWLMHVLKVLIGRTWLPEIIYPSNLFNISLSLKDLNCSLSFFNPNELFVLVPKLYPGLLEFSSSASCTFSFLIESQFTLKYCPFNCFSVLFSFSSECNLSLTSFIGGNNIPCLLIKIFLLNIFLLLNIFSNSFLLLGYSYTLLLYTSAPGTSLLTSKLSLFFFVKSFWVCKILWKTVFILSLLKIGYISE